MGWGKRLNAEARKWLFAFQVGVHAESVGGCGRNERDGAIVDGDIKEINKRCKI